MLIETDRGPVEADQLDVLESEIDDDQCFAHLVEYRHRDTGCTAAKYRRVVVDKTWKDPCGKDPACPDGHVLTEHPAHGRKYRALTELHVHRATHDHPNAWVSVFEARDPEDGTIVHRSVVAEMKREVLAAPVLGAIG